MIHGQRTSQLKKIYHKQFKSFWVKERKYIETCFCRAETSEFPDSHQILHLNNNRIHHQKNYMEWKILEQSNLYKDISYEEKVHVLTKVDFYWMLK